MLVIEVLKTAIVYIEIYTVFSIFLSVKGYIFIFKCKVIFKIQEDGDKRLLTLRFL